MEKKKVIKKKPAAAPEKKPKAARKPAKIKRSVKAAPEASVVGLHNLKAPAGSHKKKKLLGRGPGSGHGKTSTRGSKGQTSRAGRDFYPGFEGGQTPLIRRIPKRGFSTADFRKEFQIINLKDVKKIKDAVISPEVLEKEGLIRSHNLLVKVLGDGDLSKPVSIQAHAFSRQAADKIQKAGGKAEIITIKE